MNPKVYFFGTLFTLLNILTEIELIFPPLSFISQHKHTTVLVILSFKYNEVAPPRGGIVLYLQPETQRRRCCPLCLWSFEGALFANTRVQVGTEIVAFLITCLITHIILITHVYQILIILHFCNYLFGI